MAGTINRRYTSVDGPIKRESVFWTSDGTDGDTVVSLLANPSYVSIKVVSTDLTGTADPSSATLSGKTATIHDSASSVVYEIEFTGF